MTPVIFAKKILVCLSLLLSTVGTSYAENCEQLAVLDLEAQVDIKQPENRKAPYRIVALLLPLADHLNGKKTYCGYDHDKFKELLVSATQILWTQQKKSKIRPHTAQAWSDGSLRHLWEKVYTSGKLGFRKNVEAAKCWHTTYASRGKKCLMLDNSIKQQF